MKIKSRTCSTHRARFGFSVDHEAHAYRLFRFGPARRCPAEHWMEQLLQWERAHPSTEVQTLDEIRRIRELLERSDSLPT
jgi:hypothetical protein